MRPAFSSEAAAPLVLVSGSEKSHGAYYRLSDFAKIIVFGFPAQLGYSLAGYDDTPLPFLPSCSSCQSLTA